MKYLLFTLLVSQFITGQYGVQFQNPKTPEVFQFEKYGNVPVSQYTGRPNVTIPLYTIKTGDINIPLNLTYSSNGIRVDEEASPVGLGWYLGTGMISQIRIGKDDLFYSGGSNVMLPDFFWSSDRTQYVLEGNPYWQFFGYTGPNPYRYMNPEDPQRQKLFSSTPSNTLDQYFAAKVSTDGSITQEGLYRTLYFPRNGQYLDYSSILQPSSDPRDISVDVFQANFFGHELYFYINPNGGNIQVMNNEKYKIELFKKTTVNEKNRWKITAPDGISYYFDQENITSTDPRNNQGLIRQNIDDPISNINSEGTGYLTAAEHQFFPSANSNGVSRTWKITSIKDINGHTVDFNYDDLNDLYFFSGNSGICSLNNITYDTNAIRIFGYNYENNQPLGNSESIYTSLTYIGKEIKHTSTSTLIKQEKSVLSSITFNNSTILFNNSNRIDIPGDKKIDDIQIFSGESLIKQISFNYDYFINPIVTDDTQKRLRLNSISFGEKPYVFTYNQTPLPLKDSNSFDYWGFYNGMPNTSTINNPLRLSEDSSIIYGWANDFLPILEGKANRSAHPDYCKAGILEKIQYPTGGRTEFVYELNEFDNYFFPNYDNKIGVSSTKPYTYLTNYSQTKSQGFGLRVKETTDFTGNGSSYKKVYTYEGGKHIPAYVGSSGDEYRVEELPTFNYPSQWKNYSYYSSFFNMGSRILGYVNTTFQSSFLGNGNFVGYDSVTVEEQSKDFEAHNGKIKSYYTNIPDVSPRDKYVPPGAYGTDIKKSSYDLFGYSIRNSDIDNGLLMKEEIFDKNSLHIITTDYVYDSKIIPSALKYNVTAIETPETHGYLKRYFDVDISGENIANIIYKEYLFFYYPLKMTHTRLKSKKVTEFFDTGSKWNTTNYFYNFTKNPSGKSIANELGDIFYEENTIPNSNWVLESDNILDLPKSKYIKKNGFIEETINYKYSELDFGIYGQVETSELKKIEMSKKGITDIDKKKILFYDIYDSLKNLVQYHNDTGFYTTIIWGYSKTQPIAKIENAKYSEIESRVTHLQDLSILDIDATSEQALRDELNSLRNALPNAIVTTYTYDPLIGVTSITDPKGYTTFYNYDAFGRLKNVKDADGNILSENEYHYKN